MRKRAFVAAAVGILLGLASTPASAVCVPSYTCSMYREGQCVEHTTTTCVPVPDPAIYGAIAYGPNSDRFGYSYNFTNRRGAESRARNECGENDCVVAAWFYNRCGALATSSRGEWGGAQDVNQARAKAGALKICADQGGGDCQIRVSLCSPQ